MVWLHVVEEQWWIGPEGGLNLKGDGLKEKKKKELGELRIVILYGEGWCEYASYWTMKVLREAVIKSDITGDIL